MINHGDVPIAEVHSSEVICSERHLQ